MTNVIPVLTISAPDPTGGAGTFADIKTISSHHCYGMAAMVGIVVQNTMRVEDVVFFDSSLVDHQLKVIFDDIPPLAIKVSDSGDKNTIDVIAKRIAGHRNVVVDPALIATTGDMLTTEENVEYIKHVLFPHALVVTPNIDEAKFLTKMEISSVEDMITAGKHLLSYGCKNVLMKGGHLQGEIVTDVLIGQKVYTFTHNRVHTINTHGTGCALSTSIACNLAKGYTLEHAVEKAIAFVYNGLLQSSPLVVGSGSGPVSTHFLIER